MRIFLCFLSVIIPLLFCGCAGRLPKQVQKGTVPLIPSGIKPVPDSYQNAVVKLNIISCSPDFRLPWQNHIQKKWSGSGVYLGNGKILTVAHLVQDSTCITVRRRSDGTLENARIVAENPQNDLALLEICGSDFFRDIAPVPLASEIPPPRSGVIFAAYPPSSDLLSVTEGIVSRVEVYRYKLFGSYLPAVQFDADFAPGMDGGGIFFGDCLAGIAFQGNRKGEGLGYMIPVTVIRHFLKDAEDGTIDGYGSFGFYYDTLCNPAAREYRKMKKNESGILITRVLPRLSPKGSLKVGDVIMEIEGHPMTNDGFLKMEDGTLVQFRIFVSDRQIGERVRMKILRNGRPANIRILVTRSEPLVPYRPVRKRPEYFVRGGLVFTGLSTGVLGETGGSVPGMPGQGEEQSKQKKECAVLTAVLSDRINMDYDGIVPAVLRKVNGVPVISLSHAKKLIDGTKTGFVVLEFNDGITAVMEAEAIREADRRIRKNHNLPEEREEEQRR